MTHFTQYEGNVGCLPSVAPLIDKMHSKCPNITFIHDFVSIITESPVCAYMCC